MLQTRRADEPLSPISTYPAAALPDDRLGPRTRAGHFLWAIAMSKPSFEDQVAYEALGRLLDIARRDTGQSRRVADFLLAWHNAEENGGWDPTDLWNVDTAIADDMLTVVQLIRESNRYPAISVLKRKFRPCGKPWRNGGKGLVGMSTRLIVRFSEVLQQLAAKFLHCPGGWPC